ncbi:chromosome segregation protein SMC [Corticimicrobacter populi]|uniref:Chromosome partition protein Smc n=1 Tax=Corticimicrobacter populi TaxID=2175229 RepID=A0A2V1K4M7_9BURK|nr:chromosome segregation protein SMC [Corticimicrobacter populi]PWF25193.1 chromosome segregation protein SMC [Corticimicrobacter populi]
MRLTQIKLAGFKSFVDPTVIPVPSQLVGVVGPNGCGKSNIIDAVRWVLGESKASELRGESMQDVIFNGSGGRKPAARASVELVFDNAEGRAVGQWSVYAEIAVRRVLTRDGTSSYFINNQQVRRRDIHDLFLGTGLGARGYAIIGQGMIARLIEARPEELRVYLEEAAGVSRYKERRRETENRLGDTRENLVRVEDILRELDTQLAKLERQAEVARQYRDLQAEGEKKQHMLWLLKERAAVEEKRRFAREIEQTQTELEGAIARMRTGEVDLEQRRQAHYAAGDAVHAAQGVLYEANALVGRLESDIRHLVDSRARLENRCVQLRAQQAEWEQQQTHCGEQIEVMEAELEISAAKVEEARLQAELAQGNLPEIEQQVRQAAQQREQMRSELARVEQHLALAAQTQRDASRQLQVLETRQERLKQEFSTLEQPDIDRLAQLAGDLKAAEEGLQQAQLEQVRLEEQGPQADQARREAQAAVQQETGRLAQLDARLEALRKLQEDVQKQGALEPWIARHELGKLARLWQKLTVDAGWEAAFEAILRERMTALEVSNLDWTRAFAADAPPARLAFYQQAAPAAVAPAALPGVAPLLDRLRTGDPALRTLLADWLGHAYIAEDLGQALKLRDQMPAGTVLVVRDGHLVDAHSVRFYAPDSEQAGMLARQQEIENLQREIRAQQLIADQTRTAAARAEAEWQRLSQAMGPARQRVGEMTRRVHDIQLEHSRLQQQAQQSGERATRLREDMAEVQAQQEELRATGEEAQIRFEELDEQLAVQQEAFAEAEMEGERIAASAEQARERLRERERMAHEAEFSDKGLQHRLGEIRRNLQLAEEQLRRTQAELTQQQQELLTLEGDTAREGLQEALERRAEAEEKLAQARQQLDTLAARLREADEERVRQEHVLEPLRARITELQLQEQAARLAQEQFAEQLDARQANRDKLGEELAELSADWQRPEWLQAEVQRIARRIDALGSVNLAALEELRTAQERKDFLDSQYTDLQLAIETLEDAIRKIDRETRQLLQETFNTVNQHFGELFPVLFGGGEARLTMTGDEILDAGVQVMAQPPGKRNSTIHLLSGGEKALTATALVFALFKLNPAPFCLLDEVDAPLDDANTERYAKLVSGMSGQTQFLFISHNKIAMQIAQQLIGVTMQEQGVSRIVAVDMEAALQWTA